MKIENVQFSIGSQSQSVHRIHRRQQRLTDSTVMRFVNRCWFKGKGKKMRTPNIAPLRENLILEALTYSTNC